MMRLSLATAVGILAMSQSGVASAATVNEAYADSWMLDHTAKIASEFRAKSQQITLTGVEGNDGPSTTISKVNIDGSFEQFRDGELSLVSDGNKVFELGSDGKWHRLRTFEVMRGVPSMLTNAIVPSQDTDSAEITYRIKGNSFTATFTRDGEEITSTATFARRRFTSTSPGRTVDVRPVPPVEVAMPKPRDIGAPKAHGNAEIIAF